MPEVRPPDLDENLNPQPPDLDDNGVPESGMASQIYDSVFNAPKFITDPAQRFAESISGVPGAMTGGFMDAIKAVPDVARNMFSEPMATMGGFVGGGVEGAASMLSPANVATLGRGKLPMLAAKVLGGVQAGHGVHEISEGNVAEGLGDIGFGALSYAGGRSPKLKQGAVYKGQQPGFEDLPPTDLFNVPVEGGGMTTVSADTVRKMGYEVPPVPPPIKPTNIDPNLNQGMGDPMMAGSTPYSPTPVKPKLKLNTDGTYTDMNTGEVIDSTSLTGEVLNETPASLWDRPENIAQRKANELAQGGPDDLGAWAAHEHFRDAEMEAGRRDPGPYKQKGGIIDITPSKQRDILNTPIKAEDFGSDFFKTPTNKDIPITQKQIPEGQPIDNVSAVKNNTPVEPNIAPAKNPPVPYTDRYQGYREAPIGIKYNIKPENFNQKTLKDAIKLGFDFQNFDDSGRIVLKKVRPSPQIQDMDDKMLEDSTLIKVANLPRTLMASMDMSAPLRQGLGLIHKKAFWTALPDMFKAYGSEDAYKNIQEGILSDPIFKKSVSADGKIKPSYAERMGLIINDLHGNRDESIISNLADKVPGVRASNRAYTVFLNKLRADSFKQMTKDYGVLSGPNNRQNVMVAKEIATFINNASGRGRLKGKVLGQKIDLEDSAKTLATLLFSPRLIASRLGMMTRGGAAVAGELGTMGKALVKFDPSIYLNQPPNIRREYLKSLASTAAIAGSFVGLGKLAGGEVEHNPASSDFGKLKLGNTRIDPYGGYQQYVVLMQRLMPHIDLSSIGLGEIGGMMKSTNTGREYSLTAPGYGESDQFDVLERFVRSKTNPIINFGWGLLRAQKEISGKPMDFTSVNPLGEEGENLMDNSIANRFIPMILQDFHELIREEVTPPEAKALAGFLATFGMGTQTYGNK